MVSRDPQTGKFVSGGSGHSWSQQTRYSGHIHTTIPAADLAGGALEQDLVGAEAELLDFSDKLENDEVYRIHQMDVAALLAMPTTATAESSCLLNYAITPDSDIEIIHRSPTHYPGALVTDERGIIDVSAYDREAGGMLFNGLLYAEASASDSVNGTGLGAAPAIERETVHFGPDGPVFDRDDELYGPFEINIENVSDHAVVTSLGVLFHGHVEELD